MMKPKIFSYPFTLTAAEVGPGLEMPLPSLVTTIIDTATLHANAIGIGFDKLRPHNASWVLSRLSIELDRMPRVGGHYVLDTWVEGVGRLSSDRGFAIMDTDSTTCIGRVHTIWMAIDLTTRRPVDLSVLGDITELYNTDPQYPSTCSRIAPLKGEDEGYDFRFRVSDIDVNRHVTTRRYIDLIVDAFPLETYEEKRIGRFEIAFKHEARYGQTAHVSRQGTDLAILVDNTPSALARMIFVDKNI
ncbi:MAG: thioesterase [Muribaculaceae bacterium]|nr:thioesterase [Muribaculaceae bacterium]